MLKYLNSQDIPYETEIKRVFLSDGEIHFSAGYLYAKGEDPTKYNFQHPPLIKYLYGFSSIFFGNPYIVQILLALLLSIGTYAFARALSLHSISAFLASIFLVTDPVFLEVSTQALLDLGQALFAMLFVYTSLRKRNSYVLRGIMLGLCAASKFWAPALFFIIVISAFHIYKKQFNIKVFIKYIFTAVIIFSLTYSVSFVYHFPFFNIIFFQIKMLKYWFHHSVSTVLFASLFLFISSYFKTWWNPVSIIKMHTWSLLYPIGIAAQIVFVIRKIRENKIDRILFVSLIPVAYLIYLGFQAPYPRYFILFLPYFYVSLIYFLQLSVKKIINIS